MELSKQELIDCLKKYNYVHKHNINHLKRLNKKSLEKLLINTHNELHGSGLFDIGNEVYERVKNFVKGFRDDFSNPIQKFLQLFGNNKIISAQACRDPVIPAIETVLDLISLGEYSKNKKNLQFDQIFHLYLIVTLKSNEGVITKVRVEKNEQIGIYRFDKLCSSYVDIPIKENITLYNLLENGIRNTTRDKFFEYNSVHNNCQDFITLLLKSNKKFFDITDKILSFVKQNTDGILTGIAKKFAITVPQLASRFRALTGLGKNDFKKKKRKRNRNV